MSESRDAEEAEFDWLRPYVAGAFDWSGTLQVSVTQNGSYKLGYAISLRVQLQKTDQTAVGLVDEFCENIGVAPKLRVEDREGKQDRYILSITTREDVATFLEAVFPFLVVRHEQVKILLEEVIPRLEDGEHSTKRGWLDMMFYIDKIHETGSQRGSGNRQYDLDYFQDLWDMR